MRAALPVLSLFKQPDSSSHYTKGIPIDVGSAQRVMGGLLDLHDAAILESKTPDSQAPTAFLESKPSDLKEPSDGVGGEEGRALRTEGDARLRAAVVYLTSDSRTDIMDLCESLKALDVNLQQKVMTP